MSMWDGALEMASKITGPYQLAAFVSALLSLAFRPALKSKKPRFAMLILAIVLATLGIFALGVSAYNKSSGVYHIRVVVLGTDGQPVPQADLSSSAGGELKQANGNWEYDLAPQARPSTG